MLQENLHFFLATSSHSSCWKCPALAALGSFYGRFARRAWNEDWRELRPDLVGATNQLSEVPKVSEQLHLVKIDVDGLTNDHPEVPSDNPGRNLVSRAYANYRSPFLLNVCLAQPPARAVSLHFAARASPRCYFQDSPGWSYPRSKSGENRSYSCRRFLFWHSEMGEGPILGFTRLEADETATQDTRRSMQEAGAINQTDSHGIRLSDPEAAVFHLFSRCAASLHCTALHACKSSSLCSIIWDGRPRQLFSRGRMPLAGPNSTEA